MFDVLPPTPAPRRSSSPRRRTPPRRSRAAAAAAPGPRVLELQWRLPARLRRPIRQELAKQRRMTKQKAAIVAFERRPLYSEVPTSHPNYGRPVVDPENRGSEHHTGDVYLRSRPNVAISTPPYRAARPTSKSARLTTPPAPRLKPVRRSVVAQKVHQLPPAPAGPSPLAQLGNDVRDVPYRWAQSNTTAAPDPALFVNEAKQLLVPVKLPKRRFTLPLHFSIFPWRKKSVSSTEDSSKKKLHNGGA